MYNTKQKEQFLSSLGNENTHNAYLVIFKKSEAIEKSYGKDIADMTLTEVLSLLDVISGKGAQTASSCRSMLSTYTDWCIRNGKSVMSENNVSKISYEAIDKKRSYKTCYVGSEKEFRDIIDIAFPKSDPRGIVAIRRSIVILYYLGMNMEEIKCLRKNNIDFEGKMIYSPVYDSIAYSADDELLGYLKTCLEIDEIEYENDQKKKAEKICINDYVYRAKVGRYRPIDYDGTVATSFVWKRCDELNERYFESTGIYKKFTPKSLADSRLFIDYRESKDKEDFLNNYKIGLSLRSEKTDRLLYIATLNFKKNYEAWEKAFY